MINITNDTKLEEISNWVFENHQDVVLEFRENKDDSDKDTKGFLRVLISKKKILSKHKELHYFLSFMLIWLASGMNFYGFQDKNVFLIILSFVLGVTGGVYTRMINS